MRRKHSYILSLGSNIRPSENLPEAVRRLGTHGRVGMISSVWESEAVGSGGPNYLNVCLEFESPLMAFALKRTVLRRVESQLGRIRTTDPNAPRPMDIDILMRDGRPLNLRRWQYAFVVVPLADLMPGFRHPYFRRPLAEVASATRAAVWMVAHQLHLRP
jgi:2-amino-4-hydroxy-6-hydroxymethyldihydropteridine diphosphokinase